jgi:hypothetical protein
MFLARGIGHRYYPCLGKPQLVAPTLCVSHDARPHPPHTAFETCCRRHIANRVERITLVPPMARYWLFVRKGDSGDRRGQSV